MDRQPSKRVVWEWLEQYFPLEGIDQTDEWVGTRVEFDLQEAPGGSSTLVFRHQGLTPQLACYDMCEPGWNFALESLRAYLEEGTGSPYIETA